MGKGGYTEADNLILSRGVTITIIVFAWLIALPLIGVGIWMVWLYLDTDESDFNYYDRDWRAIFVGGMVLVVIFGAVAIAGVILMFHLFWCGGMSGYTTHWVQSEEDNTTDTTYLSAKHQASSPQYRQPPPPHQQRSQYSNMAAEPERVEPRYALAQPPPGKGRPSQQPPAPPGEYDMPTYEKPPI